MGKRTLYQKGTLRDSIHTTEESTKRIIVSSNLDYAEIQNNGGIITVTAQMKKLWWAQYAKFAGEPRKTTKSGRQANTAANRKLNAKAEFCKRMALMKVGSKIKIPQRQFLGESQTLMKQLEEKFHTKIA